MAIATEDVRERRSVDRHVDRCDPLAVRDEERARTVGELRIEADPRASFDAFAIVRDAPRTDLLVVDRDEEVRREDVNVVVFSFAPELRVELGPNRIAVIHTGWTDQKGKPEFWSQMPYLELGVGALMASKGGPASPRPRKRW